MYKIKETIVVEGIYDKIKLSRFIDAVIIVTNGFCVFSDDRILESIKKMADETGIVILTDSDSAGFKIRKGKTRLCTRCSRQGKTQERTRKRGPFGC